MQGPLWEGAHPASRMPVVGGFCLFGLGFLSCIEFMQEPSPALFGFPILPKPPGCCEVSTLRSGWWKAEVQRGSERKSPTKPRGRRKGRSCMGSACNTSEIVLDVFHGSVCCQSLSYGWSEVRKAGSGGPADCRQIFSPDYLR